MSIAATRLGGDGLVASLPKRIRRWELWAAPGRGLAFILIVDLVVFAAAGMSIATTDPTATDLGRAGLLIGLAILYSEAARRVERVRDYLHLA